MYNQVTSIFLSMALIAALQSFVDSQRDVAHWLTFIYFVLNNIRYLYGDIRWSEQEESIRRQGLGAERAIDTIFYVLTRFSIVIVAFCVKSTELFFWFFGLSLAVGSISLVFAGTCIYDRSKDVGDVKIMPVWWHWLIFNIIEGVIVICAAFILHCNDDILHAVPSLTDVPLSKWVIGIAFSILFFIMLSDWVLHQQFLFDSTGASNVQEAKNCTMGKRTGA